MRALFILIALSGCATFPQLDATIDPALENAQYPRLVPLAPLLAQAQSTPLEDQSVANQDMADRIARLQSRANALRGPVLPAAAQRRLRQGVDVSALQ